MPAKSRKARSGRSVRIKAGLRVRPQAIDGYELRVLLHPCSVCGVSSGRCVRTSSSDFGAKPAGEPLAQPHQARVSAAERDERYL